MELKSHTTKELEELYSKVVQLREQVNKLVNEYGYGVNDLPTRLFEHDIEREYGRKTLEPFIKLDPPEESLLTDVNIREIVKIALDSESVSVIKDAKEKSSTMNYLIGKIIAKTRGTINPDMVKTEIKRQIDSHEAI